VFLDPAEHSPVSQFRNPAFPVRRSGFLDLKLDTLAVHLDQRVPEDPSILICSRRSQVRQAHTVRGFVSILGSKGGEKIESSKHSDGERTYRIAK